MCQGLTHTYHGLLGVRFLMGICETALPAGAGLLIASYYRKKELGLRFAMFFAFGDLGACFSGVSMLVSVAETLSADKKSSCSHMQSKVWTAQQDTQVGDGSSSSKAS